MMHVLVEYRDNVESVVYILQIEVLSIYFE